MADKKVKVRLNHTSGGLEPGEYYVDDDKAEWTRIVFDNADNASEMAAYTLTGAGPIPVKRKKPREKPVTPRADTIDKLKAINAYREETFINGGTLIEKTKAINIYGNGMDPIKTFKNWMPELYEKWPDRTYRVSEEEIDSLRRETEL